jgi:putative mycofactocin binding protein MftB
LSVTEAQPARAAFAVEQASQLNRRLVFLKSRLLVELVSSLHEYPSAAEAIDAVVPEGQHGSYERALARLAASEVIDAR